MSNVGTKAAIGAAAAAVVLGGKELAHMAPQMAMHSGPALEIAASKSGLAFEAAGGSTNSLRSGSNNAIRSTSSGTFSSSGDISGSLGSTLHVGRVADAKLDPNQRLGDFGTPQGAGTLNTTSQSDVLGARPVIACGNSDFGKSTFSSYFSTAEPKLADDLTVLKPPLSRNVVENIVKRDLASTAQAASTTAGSNLSFEVLTGKLKVETSRTIGGMKITGGEINLYVVGGAITGSVLACNALADLKFRNCIEAAIRTAMAKAVGDLKPKSGFVTAD
jgi:hypothetical protein